MSDNSETEMIKQAEEANCVRVSMFAILGIITLAGTGGPSMQIICREIWKRYTE